MLRETIEDTVFLTGYDVLKGTSKKTGVAIPAMSKVGANLVGAAAYEYLGTKVVNMASTKFMPQYKVEADLLGKVLLLPVGIMIGEKVLGGSSQYGNIILKSLVAVGSQSIYRHLL